MSFESSPKHSPINNEGEKKQENIVISKRTKHLGIVNKKAKQNENAH